MTLILSLNFLFHLFMLRISNQETCISIIKERLPSIRSYSPTNASSSTQSSFCLQPDVSSFSQPVASDLWHGQLGHCSYGFLEKVMIQNLILKSGVPFISSIKKCVSGKNSNSHVLLFKILMKEHQNFLIFSTPMFEDQLPLHLSLILVTMLFY